MTTNEIWIRKALVSLALLKLVSKIKRKQGEEKHVYDRRRRPVSGVSEKKAIPLINDERFWYFFEVSFSSPHHDSGVWLEEQKNNAVKKKRFAVQMKWNLRPHYHYLDADGFLQTLMLFYCISVGAKNFKCVTEMRIRPKCCPS